MKWLILFGKGVGWFLELFFAFLMFYVTVSIYGAVIPVGEINKEGDICIYVQSNGIHTDICMPTETEEMNWLEFIPADDYNGDSYEYVSIGWGDKGFFLNTPTWAELKVSTALNAAFLPSTTAMHVWYDEEPEIGETCKKVWISKLAYKHMVFFVKNSFRLKDGKVDLISNSGYTDHDNFYEAYHSYHLFRTCNRWTNNALKSANVKTGIFALFPDGILSHLQ
ncbi:MAG: TIGR02117 family protein [Crocinitomicaceae bacterium]|nr:TIGR02117 family protein [Crocinitomicaceae bacterium]